MDTPLPVNFKYLGAARVPTVSSAFQTVSIATSRRMPTLNLTRLPFDTQWPAPTVEAVLTDLFRSFAVVFSRLLWLDIQTISSLPPGATKPPVLISGQYMQVFNAALRPRNDDLHGLVGSLYNGQIPLDTGEALIWTSLPTQMVMLHTAQAFVDSEVEGTEHLSQLVSLLLEHVYRFAGLRDPLKLCLCIVQHLIAIRLNPQRNQEEQAAVDPSSWKLLAPSAYSMFEAVSTSLYASFEKSASSPNLDAELAKDLVKYAEHIPSGLARLDTNVLETLFEKLIGHSNIPDGFDIDLLQCVWMLRLLKRFICKGRMDMRITGVEQMHVELISIYHRYNGKKPQNLRYVAQVLIDEQILNYIVGPDSHPQLISRSGNLLAFLAVTNSYTTAYTDVIWDTVSNHQDPRVVSATLVMLHHMIGYLSLPHMLYLCEKLQLLALDRFGQEARQLVEALLRQLLPKPETELQEPTESLIPTFLGLRILRDALNPFTGIPWELANFGQDMFTLAYSGLAKLENRHSILRNCVEDIQAGSLTAAGSVIAILKGITTGPNLEQSVAYLTDCLNAPSIVVERTCQFTKTQDQAPSDQLFLYKLSSHFELLHGFILKQPDSISADLDVAIWDHLVGSSAINNHCRDLGWDCFRHTAEKADGPNSFVERGLAQQLPRLHPESFTPSSYRFFEAAVRYQSRYHPQVCTQFSDSIHVPLEDQLWNCILTVPPRSIESEITNLLVSLYLEPEQTTKDVIRPILELTHVALVQKCIKRLTDACALLKSSTRAGETEGSSMNVDRSEEEIQVAELCFSRTLRFLTVMLQSIRANKDLSPTPARSSPKLKKRDANEANKEPIIIKYQAFDGNEQSDIASTTLSGQDSLAELRRKLSEVTGFPYFKLICGGQHIDLEKDCDMIIDGSGIASRGLLIIIKRADSQISHTSSMAAMGGSAFERELLKYFNDLYDLMDSDDRPSYAVRVDFLWRLTRS